MKEQRIGKVKWFKAKEGYGFVTDIETGKEYFFHYTAIETDKEYKTLYPNWMVRFTIGENEKGECADWIKSAPDLIKKNAK